MISKNEKLRLEFQNMTKDEPPTIFYYPEKIKYIKYIKYIDNKNNDFYDGMMTMFILLSIGYSFFL